ncbi:MAG: magnesium/cobalt transporter CorA [Saprospiraceae bacterium]|nr:magnesium/cobalt transporter CorA [Saprospiraceae bacterium]
MTNDNEVSTARRKRKIGLPPGSLVYTGTKRALNPYVSICQYDFASYQDEGLVLEEIFEVDDQKVTWVDVRGLSDVDLISEIGKGFKIHSLVLEDILDVQHRPKFEDYDDGFFIILRTFTFDKETLQVLPEQVSIYVGSHFIISFQEASTDLFGDIRERLSTAKGKVRKYGADYLCYALMDRMMDNYYHLFELVGESLQELELEIMDDANEESKDKIHQLKGSLLLIRRSLGPMRESINLFVKADSDLVEDTTQLYVRDLYDHAVHAMDMLEIYRENLIGLQDLFLSELSFKMNKVMQVLTIVATIFIPLTFIVGVYGMNFEHMPELHWKYGYLMVWGLMIACIIAMFYFFRRKRWL